MSQLELFEYCVRPDFCATSWPKHPSAGKRVRIIGPASTADGRSVDKFYARVQIDDGRPGACLMGWDDLELVPAQMVNQ